MKIIYIIGMLVVGSYACTSVSIQDVQPLNQGQQNNCDTASVTFLNTIQPIIQANCSECHSASSPSSGISIANHAQVSRYGKNGVLYGAITGASGYMFMPKDGPPLSSCDIAKIKKWIDAGSPNN